MTLYHQKFLLSNFVVIDPLVLLAESTISIKEPITIQKNAVIKYILISFLLFLYIPFPFDLC